MARKRKALFIGSAIRRGRCAACSLHVNELGPGELAGHAPLAYKPVESDGAARAAREIVSVMENRNWASG